MKNHHSPSLKTARMEAKRLLAVLHPPTGPVSEGPLPLTLAVGAAMRLLRHPRFKGMSVTELIGSEGPVQLRHALDVVAMERGSRDWAEYVSKVRVIEAEGIDWYQMTREYLRAAGGERDLAARAIAKRIAEWHRSLAPDEALRRAGQLIDDEVAVVAGLYGSYRLGHTVDDVKATCRILSAWLGYEIGCVWDFFDMWGAGGDSTHYAIFHTEDGVRLGDFPDGIWQFLGADMPYDANAPLRWLREPRPLPTEPDTIGDVTSPEPLNIQHNYACEVDPSREIG